MIRNDSDILNLGLSEGRCKRPSGARGGALEEKKYVSKWTHGFKHIIHIDDFPLNGHSPSIKLWDQSSY